MSESQMKVRCPNCFKIGIAKLENYKLTFPRKSKNRQCGVASVEESAGSDVWGVVYKLNEEDQSKLDKNEGYNPEGDTDKNSYNRVEIEVLLSDSNQKLKCHIYIAVKQHGIFGPNKTYLETILIGASENKLPEPYLSSLISIRIRD